MDVEQGWLLFLEAALTALVFYAAHKKGYFHYPLPQSNGIPGLPLIGAFGLYFGVAFFLFPLLQIHLFPHLDPAFSIGQKVGWLHLAGIGVLVFVLGLYCLFLPRPLLRHIFSPGEKCSWKEDMMYGALTWVVAFPAVAFVGQVLEVLTYVIYGKQEVEQSAVRYLKMTLPYGDLFWLTAFVLVVLIPFVEELLFRGFLQGWLRGKMGRGAAIFTSSAIFALFHYSGDQGVGNIEIIGSLFAFSLFLGFIYERQGSLLANITVHSLFNAFTIILLFLSTS